MRICLIYKIKLPKNFLIKKMETVFIVKKIRSSYWHGEEHETGKILQTGSTKKEVVAKLISAKRNQEKITIMNEDGEIVKALVRISSKKNSN